MVTLHCYTSSYSHSPLHINHSAVTTNNSLLQCMGCKVISSLSLSQQHLLRHLIGLLGCNFLVPFTIENYPTRTQVRFLGELIELQSIINGDLHSVVSFGRNHLYVGGLTLISRPLPSYQALVAAVRMALRDQTPLCYY